MKRICKCDNNWFFFIFFFLESQIFHLVEISLPRRPRQKPAVSIHGRRLVLPWYIHTPEPWFWCVRPKHDYPGNQISLSSGWIISVSSNGTLYWKSEAVWIPLDNVQGMKPYILVELNPIILGRGVERMEIILLLCHTQALWDNL